jgi:hypothetical protein
MLSGGPDRRLAVALVDRLGIPVVFACASPDGLSFLCCTPGRDDIAGEEKQDRPTEMLEAELIDGALLTLTDDPLIALMAEALGCPVFFLADSTAPDRQYWPMEATALEREQPVVDAVTAYAQKMLASMRS